MSQKDELTKIKNKPKSSIIVPVYNAELYLRECLDSIINQTFQDWECVLVDDGSKDTSGFICDEYALKDTRFKVIHTANGGLSCARNLALDIVCGDYIMFVDADDKLFDDSSLENSVAILDQEMSIDILHFDYVVFGEGRTIKERKKKPDQLFNGRAEIYEHFGLIHDGEDRLIFPAVWAKVYRKRLFDTIRFPAGRLYEDAWMHANMFELVNSVLITDCGLYGYRIHESSITHSKVSEDRVNQRMEMFLHVYSLLQKHSSNERSYNKLFWTVLLIIIVAKMHFGMGYGKEIVNELLTNKPKSFTKSQKLQMMFARFVGLNNVLNLRAWYYNKRQYSNIADL